MTGDYCCPKRVALNWIRFGDFNFIDAGIQMIKNDHDFAKYVIKDVDGNYLNYMGNSTGNISEAYMWNDFPEANDMLRAREQQQRENNHNWREV